MRCHFHISSASAEMTEHFPPIERGICSVMYFETVSGALPSNVQTVLLNLAK